MSGGYDVLVLGEVLVELSSPGPLRASEQLTLSFSGDALNAAAAAAATGAAVGLLARVGDDELGDAVVEHIERCGVDTALVRRVPRPNGVYFTIADPDGGREFVYVRQGSAGSTLEPSDVDAAAPAASRVLVVSGVTQAISPSAAAAAEHAARLVREAGGAVVYDPNFRPRLTTPAFARAAFARIAPSCSLVIPSHPAETTTLLGARTPEAAAGACLRLGAGAAAVSCGADGVVLNDGGGPVRISAAPAGEVVDATGAGDVLAGTIAARLARGERLEAAARDGVVAAARSLTGRGGTGWLSAEPPVMRNGAGPGRPPRPRAGRRPR